MNPGLLEIVAEGQTEFVHGVGKDGCIKRADELYSDYVIKEYTDQREWFENLKRELGQ